MLAASNARNVTARLLGDPDPRRFERSEAIKATIRYTPSMPDGKRQKYPKRSITQVRMHQILRAIQQGSSNVQSVCDSVGTSYRTAGEYISRAAKNGWVRVSAVLPGETGGRIYTYEITSRGIAELASEGRVD